MKRWRKIMVLVLLAGIVLGHLYDVIKLREHWPFSFYPMYAKLRDKQIVRRGVLQGTNSDLKLNEFEIKAAYLDASADKLLKQFQTDPQGVRDQLRSLLRWNNRTAHDKSNRTPKLTSIALYEIEYDLSAEDDLRPPTRRFVTRIFAEGFKVRADTTTRPSTIPTTQDIEKGDAQ